MGIPAFRPARRWGAPLALLMTGALALPAPAVAWVASPPDAQDRATVERQQRRLDSAPQGTAREYRVCRKLCDNDTNPCDPINFKYADGRCSFDNRL